MGERHPIIHPLSPNYPLELQHVGDTRIQALIPPYSLFWIAMVHDYWMHRRDDAFVEPKLVGIRGIVYWYERLLDKGGMVGPAPWWSFVDWAFPGGVPPGGIEGASSIVTLQYAYVLRYAEKLARGFGRNDDTGQYASLAAGLRTAVRRTAWETSHGLVADTSRPSPRGAPCSTSA